jgi:hypothetical protein
MEKYHHYKKNKNLKKNLSQKNIQPNTVPKVHIYVQKTYIDVHFWHPNFSLHPMVPKVVPMSSSQSNKINDAIFIEIGHNIFSGDLPHGNIFPRHWDQGWQKCLGQGIGTRGDKNALKKILHEASPLKKYCL